MKSCCTPTRNIDESKTNSQIILHEKSPFSIKDMVQIKGGEFLMGTNDKEGFQSDVEGPIRKVIVDSFYIDKYAVTNDKFEQFVNETNYVTEAEKFGWTYVFYSFLSEVTLRGHPERVQQVPWWVPVKGAYWKQPEGPDSTIQNRLNHPVVHISWNDANAFCIWSGKRLPTEAEWEFAARGGLEQKKYPWGDNLIVNGKHQCNIWQGEFPTKNTARDGYIGTSPVDAFRPNGYGLFNMAGNVWEWCEDWFSPNYHSSSLTNNPKGPDTGTIKSMRGGSYLCHKSYCNRYRVAARSSNTPDSSTGNIGFRCVADILT